MLKNSYAFSFDTIFNCNVICAALCPPKQESAPCFPSPCCGDRHFEKKRFDVRQTLDSADQTLQNLIPGQIMERQHSENIIGSYKDNTDMPYCCWCLFPCKSQSYQSLDINGRKIATVTEPCTCCTPMKFVSDDSGQALGQITVGYQSCCMMDPYLSIQNTTGKQIYGIYRNPGCHLACCSIPFQIKSAEKQALSDILVRPNMCISCCHYRHSIDVNLPGKATQAEKALLLVASRHI